MKYIIVTHTRDFDGNINHNCYYVEGVEGAWDLYEKMCDLFDEVDLVDYNTCEVIDSQTECPDAPDEDDFFIEPDDFYEEFVSDFDELLKFLGL